MIRIRSAILAGIALAGMMIPSLAPAADEHAVQISQPIISGGSGLIAVAQVPYIFWYLPYDDPAFEVSLTVAANTITTGEGTSNRNAANLLGIQLTFPMPPQTNRWRRSAPRGVFGDTLRVAIDLSKTDETTRLQKASITRGFQRKDIVPLTLFSMLENARRGWPQIKNLHVEVIGPDEFKDLAGTYSLERIPEPPKIREIRPENPRKE